MIFKLDDQVIGKTKKLKSKGVGTILEITKVKRTWKCRVRFESDGSEAVFSEKELSLQQQAPLLALLPQLEDETVPFKGDQSDDESVEQFQLNEEQ